MHKKMAKAFSTRHSAVRLPTLDERLSLIASMVRRGRAVADIGADHGYLVTYLVAAGICPRGTAVDINEQPLARAAQTAQRYGVAEHIALIQCDGLFALLPNCADDIVIAGMGGDTIIHILQNAAWHIGEKRFLLQAMTHASQLRRWLCANGYEIEEENAACANRFCYSVIAARYTGKLQPCSELFAHVGLLPQSATPHACTYVRRQAASATERARGLNRTHGKQHETRAAAELARALYHSIGEEKTIMATIAEIYSFINEFAPFSTALPWDNCGLLVRAEPELTDKILIALDITLPVIEEARALGAGLIVSHHPVIFTPLKSLSYEDPVYFLARYGISAICAHTNLDLARGGVNDSLARQLQLLDIEPLGELDSNLLSLGRIGTLAVNAPADITLHYIKKNLGANGLKYVPGPDIIRRVAVGGGACADLLPRAAKLGADLFITSDIKHHEMLLARELGVALVDAGHYCTERVILEPLARCIRERFEGVEVVLSAAECDPARYL